MILLGDAPQTMIVWSNRVLVNQEHQRRNCPSTVKRSATNTGAGRTGLSTGVLVVAGLTLRL